MIRDLGTQRVYTTAKESTKQYSCHYTYKTNAMTQRCNFSSELPQAFFDTFSAVVSNAEEASHFLKPEQQLASLAAEAAAHFKRASSYLCSTLAQTQNTTEAITQCSPLLLLILYCVIFLLCWSQRL